MLAYLKNLFAKPTKTPVDPGVVEVLTATGAVQFDLLTARLAFEPLEEKHNCDSKDFRTTLPFLNELAAVCVGLGVRECTPTMAYKIWGDVNAAFVALKKNEQFNAK